MHFLPLTDKLAILLPLGKSTWFWEVINGLLCALRCSMDVVRCYWNPCQHAAPRLMLIWIKHCSTRNNQMCLTSACLIQPSLSWLSSLLLFSPLNQFNSLSTIWHCDALLGNLRDLWKLFFCSRRFPAASILLVMLRWKKFKKKQLVFPEGSLPLLCPRWSIIDIMALL